MLFRSIHNLPLAGGVAALAAVGLLFGASCGGDGDSGASQDAAILNAITLIDGAGLHEMDEAINDGQIPADARTKVQQLQAITNITDWPDDLQSQGEALADIFAEFATALEGDSPDMARAAEISKKAHDGAHDFSHEVWKYLYEKGDVETGSTGGH
jgi:hypothetical protein